VERVWTGSGRGPELEGGGDWKWEVVDQKWVAIRRVKVFEMEAGGVWTESGCKPKVGEDGDWEWERCGGWTGSGRGPEVEGGGDWKWEVVDRNSWEVGGCVDNGLGCREKSWKGIFGERCWSMGV
jgi:hypothetical protein